MRTFRPSKPGVLPILAGLVLAGLAAAPVATDARNPDRPAIVPGRFVVEFSDPPITRFTGLRASDGSWQLAPTAAKGGRFEPDASAVKEYRAYLDRESAKALAEASSLLGEALLPRYRYAYLTNGVSLDLSAAQAQALRQVAGVSRVYPVTAERPSTDSGPVRIRAMSG